MSSKRDKLDAKRSCSQRTGHGAEKSRDHNFPLPKIAGTKMLGTKMTLNLDFKGLLYSVRGRNNQEPYCLRNLISWDLIVIQLKRPKGKLSFGRNLREPK